MSMKLSWAQKKRLQNRAFKEALTEERRAAKRERFDNSGTIQALNSEKEFLEQKIVNLGTEIKNLSSEVIFNLDQSISLNGKEGDVIKIDLSTSNGLSRFKRSLKRLLTTNGLDAEKVFEANNVAVKAAEVYYRNLAFQKAKFQDAQQKLASVEAKLRNPMKAHRRNFVKVSKANAFVLKYDNAHAPAATARAQRAKVRKFNQGKKVFLEVYGNGKLPVDVAIDETAESPATTEFVAKVAQLNGAEIDAPVVSCNIFAAYKVAKARAGAAVRTAKKTVKKATAKVAKALTTQQKIALRKAKATAKAFETEVNASKARTKAFIKDALAFFKKQAGFEEALEVLGYKVGPKALKGLEALADLMGYAVLKADGVPVGYTEVTNLR